VPLYLSWCDVKREEGKRRFYEHRGGPHPPLWGCYVVATFAAGGAYLARRYRRRWLIEAFFSSVKHDFGLKEARLRTKTGIRMWLFLACLAYSCASLARHLSQQNLTLLQAAQRILDILVDIRLLHLMADCERFSQHCSQRLKLVAA
jgi:IS4 transposase